MNVMRAELLEVDVLVRRERRRGADAGRGVDVVDVAVGEEDPGDGVAIDGHRERRGEASRLRASGWFASQRGPPPRVASSKGLCRDAGSAGRF